jgi:opacity protein-like surface antigen
MYKYVAPGLSLAMLCALLTVPHAGAEDRTGLYIGGNYGGFKARGGDFDDDNDLIEGQLGWRITPYVGIEGNYITFGKYGNRAASAEVDGYGAAIVGYFPINDSFSIYAKGGQFWWDADVKVLGITHGQDDDSFFYGLGASFQVAEMIGLTAEYKRFEIDYESGKYPVPPRSSDTDLDTVTVGVRFSF